MDDVYAGLEPRELWRHFAALNRIPRPSGQEDAARDYVHSVAAAAGADWRVDERGNAVARVPARGGSSDAPGVVVQAHLDMVCDTAPGVQHECGRDPIVPRRDGQRISASGTTLGADNGIGVAAALTLLHDPDVRHGPLELLFTVDEETGLRGALDLDPSLITAESLINLDTEDPSCLTIGCAGGQVMRLTLPIEREPHPDGTSGWELRVSGLRGGHSGLQIGEPHANAVKVLAELLARLIQDAGNLSLVSVEGGSAHNAIPREAVAIVTLRSEGPDRAPKLFEEATSELLARVGHVEPGLAVALSERAADSPTWSVQSTRSLVALLRDLPHGVQAMSPRFEETIETSVNLAMVRTEESEVEVTISNRSLLAQALDDSRRRMGRLAAGAGGRLIVDDAYPGWEPRERSPLADAAADAYQRVYGRTPRKEVVHGGLECGVIVAKKNDLDAISFGPLIEDAHTPRENVDPSTVGPTWELLVMLLGDLAR